MTQSSGSVLVVEDSPSARLMITRTLRAAGWTITPVGTAEEAIRCLEQDTFDVVVSDLHLPGVTGFELLLRFKAVAPASPVVMLSGDDKLASVLSAMRMGAFDYVVKAHGSWDTLVASVERAGMHARVLNDNRRLQRELEDRVVELDREVAERLRAQQEAATARDEAQRASRAKSAFVANMSHELRTPLTAILGYSDMLMEDAVAAGDERRKSDLERIHRSGTHLLSLINDVLDLSKVESGKVSLQLDSVSLVGLLEGVVATGRPLAASRGNQILLDLQSPLVDLTTDSRHLTQALLNLVSNACKFTENGEVTIRYRRFTEKGVRFAEIAVSDTGIGMTEEQCSRVFAQYEQADMTTQAVYGGTGLGLAISRELIALAGGTVDVSSELGVGTTFTICLPEEGPGSQALAALGSGALTLVVAHSEPEQFRQVVERLAGLPVRLVSATLEQARGLAAGASGGLLVAGTGAVELALQPTALWDPVAQTVRLPAPRVIEKPLRLRDLIALVAAAGLSPGGPPILLVEDDLLSGRVVQGMIRRLELGCVVALSGEAALAWLANEVPGLILLDLSLPGLSGDEVLARIQADPRLSAIPVAVATGSAVPAAQRQRLEAATGGLARQPPVRR